MHAGRVPWVLGGVADDLESARAPPFSGEGQPDEHDLLQLHVRVAAPPCGLDDVRFRGAALRSNSPQAGGCSRHLAAKARVLGPFLFRHVCGRVAGVLR